MTAFTLQIARDELDLGLCVTSGQTFRWDRLNDGRWVGVDGPVWYLAEQTDTTVCVQTNATRDDFERLFRLGESLRQIEKQILERGPELEPLMRGLRGLRVLRPQCAHEVFFSFLCTPNNHMDRIKRMVDVLAAYGEPMAEIGGKTLWRFPDVEVIAAIPESDLRLQWFGYRGATIPWAARQLLQRPAGWLESLRKRPYREGFKQLCSIKGIGPKLADCISLFALHQTEAAPIDTHLWQAYCRVYRPDLRDRPITDKRYTEAGDFLRARFGELTGWAHQYLFYDNALRWRSRGRASTRPGRRS